MAKLFNNTFEYKIFEVFRDPDGSYIILDVEIMKKRITLVTFMAQAVVTNQTSLIILVIKLTVFVTSLLLLVGTGMFC